MFHVISYCYSWKVEDFIVLVIVLMLLFYCTVLLTIWSVILSYIHCLECLLQRVKKGTSKKKEIFWNFNDFKECLPRDMLFCYITWSNCIKYKTIDFYSFWVLEMIFMGLWKDLRRDFKNLVKRYENLLKWNWIGKTYENMKISWQLNVNVLWFLHFSSYLCELLYLDGENVTEDDKFFLCLRWNQQKLIYDFSCRTDSIHSFQLPISISSTKDSLIFCPSQYFISLFCITTVKLFSDQTNVHTDDAAK